MEYRLSQAGFEAKIVGSKLEISNCYGLHLIEDLGANKDGIGQCVITERLNDFINKHTVSRHEMKNVVKKVIYNSYMYKQAQVVSYDDNVWYMQLYDYNLTLISERIIEGATNKSDAEKHLRDNFNIQTGLPCSVYRNDTGDSTNDGISSKARTLYVMSMREYPFEPSDIRECVSIETAIFEFGEHIRAKPLYEPKKWYMAGGNFLYSSDSRLKEITGISYPIPIFDRYEEEK